MADSSHLENQKIAISQKPFGGFWQFWVSCGSSMK